MKLTPLSEVQAPEMDDILAHERAAWARELSWDYSSTTSLISRSIAARAFSGFALTSGSRVTAYSYFLADPEKSLLGSVHALPEAEAERGASRLIDRTLAHLIYGVGTRRIESQFLFFGSDDPSPVFEAFGVKRYPRLFLTGPLDLIAKHLGTLPPEGLRLFRNSDLKATAAIVHRSFLGSADSEMSDCYSGLAGCESFVEGVLTRTGCGVYDAKASFVSLDRGVLVGAVLASRLSPGVGHIVQISVDPQAQGRGVGRRLLAASCDSLRRRGYRQMSLSVSVANRRACGWYAALGLRTVKEFAAFVWSRNGRG